MGIGTGKKECQEGTVPGRVGMGVLRYISDREVQRPFLHKYTLSILQVYCINRKYKISILHLYCGY